MKTKLLTILICFALLFPAVSFGQTVNLSTGWQPMTNYTQFGLPDATITSVILSVMQFILFLISAFAIIAIAISGIQYLTSAGNETQAENAKRTLKYAIIGSIVAMSGLIMVQEISKFLGLCLGWSLPFPFGCITWP